MTVIVELAADSRGTIQSASSGYKPTRQSSRNDSNAPGYKRADRIQFGKSVMHSSLSGKERMRSHFGAQAQWKKCESRGAEK